MERLPGEILRFKREEKNLSIDDISLNTKISKRILKKIEDSDFSNMSSFQKRYFTEIQADRVTFIGGREAGMGAAGGDPAPRFEPPSAPATDQGSFMDDDDLPF